MIACITTFLGSVLLILGLLYKHSGFIMPWLLINISYLFAGLGIFISKLASPDTHFHFMKIVAVFCYHILLAYFIISVFSYHTFLKRQRLLAQNILHLQSTSSLNSGIHLSSRVFFSKCLIPILIHFTIFYRHITRLTFYYRTSKFSILKAQKSEKFEQ